jgi:hypothetical protein
MSIIIVMICLAVSPPDVRNNNNNNNNNNNDNDLETKKIVNDFEKELQENIKENFESKQVLFPLGWSVYESGPFNNVTTHYNNDPVFYEKRIYRKPYMWPATFKSSYPVEHQSTLDPKF